MQDEILQRLINYLHDLPEPDLYQSKDEFEFYSRARFAVEEIIEQIVDCPFDAADDILWTFILETTHYQKTARSKETKELFETLYEVAIDLYYLVNDCLYS